LYLNSVDLPLVPRLLGHSRLETTQLYVIPSLEMLRDAITSIETPELKAEKPLWEEEIDYLLEITSMLKTIIGSIASLKQRNSTGHISLRTSAN